MKTRFGAIMAMVLALGSATAVRAQTGTWELGMDVAADMRWGEVEVPDFFFPINANVDEKNLNVEIPSSRIRLGYWISDVVQIEPSLGFAFAIDASHEKPQLVSSTSSLGLAVNRSWGTSHTGPFAGLGVVTRFSTVPNAFGFLSSSPQVGVPLTLGTRIGAGGVALRIATSGVWWLPGTDRGGQWGVSVGLGLSMFSNTSGAGGAS
ncbi:MAG TPA: hypothetical protein VGK93_07455 [Candidatus Eisenbacteria bacterium]|jgi:hypothetical protein